MSAWNQLKQKLSEKSATVARQGPKYRKRSDIEAERVERYLKEQAEDKKRQVCLMRC